MEWWLRHWIPHGQLPTTWFKFLIGSLRNTPRSTCAYLPKFHKEDVGEGIAMWPYPPPYSPGAFFLSDGKIMMETDMTLVRIDWNRFMGFLQMYICSI